MGYVIGAMLGDGSVEDNTTYHPYQCSLEVVDKDFILYFIKKFEEWTGYKLLLSKNTRKSYFVRTCRKEVNQILSKYKNNPLLCLHFPLNVQKQVLKGLFDAEGHAIPLSKNAVEIGITNYDKKIILLLKQILTNNDIVFKSYERRKCKEIVIRRMSEVLKFIENINGITIQRKYNKIKFRLEKAKQLKNLYYHVFYLHKQGWSGQKIWEITGKVVHRSTIQEWLYCNDAPFSVRKRIVL